MILFLLALQQAPHTALTGTFQSPRLNESSGIAVSRAHPGVLWTHNDSGDGPYLYATDLSGAYRGPLLVPGADAVDWEDITLGPCPTQRGQCLHIADTGDNDRRRKSVVVYAVPEPDPSSAGGHKPATTAPPATLHLKYPSGPEDVEAIYVSYRDSALYLVTKGRSGPIRLYRVPRTLWGSSAVVTAIEVQDLPIGRRGAAGRRVTGAAMRPDGQLVAIRTYREIYFFIPRSDGRLEPAGRPVCDIAGLEPQGEAIDFLDDSTLVLTSEAGWRSRGTIHTVRCPR